MHDMGLSSLITEPSTGPECASKIYDTTSPTADLGQIRSSYLC